MNIQEKLKEVLIVGAGPAGLAAANVLARKANVTLIEQGNSVEKRTCPSPKKCIKCGNCPMSNGVGGAGCFSDGKFVYETILGNRQVGSNLSEVIGSEEEIKYIIRAKLFFQYYFGHDIEYPSKEKLSQAQEISRRAAVNDMNYIFSCQNHIGTDKLPAVIKRIQDELTSKGVNIVTNERVETISGNCVRTNKNFYQTDAVILAPGRKGADWLESILKQNDVPIDYRAVDIGFRIETDAKIIENLANIARDIKLSFRLPWNGDLIRTFCACPNGVVTRETYEKGFNLVNGASDSQKASENSNFSLLMSIPLTHRVNCNTYADHIAMTFHDAGADKPVVQRYGDLKSKRRSQETKSPEWRIQPTLRDVLYGDVGIAMPYRIVIGLMEGIERLSAPGLMPGLNQASTLLYAPEMKRNGLKIKTDEYLQTPKKGLYIAGDGPGCSRGIVGAAASGILAAEGILRDN